MSGIRSLVVWGGQGQRGEGRNRKGLKFGGWWINASSCGNSFTNMYII